jgi:hypothetical protein
MPYSEQNPYSKPYSDDPHAVYMREYNKDPEVREKANKRARTYAASHREEARKRGLDHYYDNREKRIAGVKRRECHYKRKALAYLGGVCVSCGEDHPGVLQFNHLDPSIKNFNITTKQLACPGNYPWDVILTELDKCEILCANCHFLHHNTWLEEWITEDLAY